MLSCVRLFALPWTIARPGSSSMGVSRQKYWCELPFPSPGDISDPRIEPRSPALHVNNLYRWSYVGSKNTGVGCHVLLQGIFPTQGSNLSPALQADSVLLSPWGSSKDRNIAPNRERFTPTRSICSTNDCGSPVTYRAQPRM